MKLFTLFAVLIGCSAAVAGQAVAQTQRYETPLYTTGGQSGLERDFGMPMFGRPGTDVPKPRAAEPKEQEEAKTKTDFFAGTSGYALPRNRGTTEADAAMETPRYTTPQETTDGYAIGSKSSETSTPLFGTAAMPFGTQPGR